MSRPTTVLLLPGQGSQRERMAAGLYGAHPQFTAAMDGFFDALDAHGAPEGQRDRPARHWLRPAPHPDLDDARIAQPLLLGVGHALGRAVAATVGPPGLLLGHSAGELAAAVLAGVFRAADLGRLAAARARVVGDDGRGGMLAVAAAEDELPAGLGPVTVAAVNGPRQTVLAGPSDALERARATLTAAGRTVLPLRSGHAFHSPSVSAMARRFTQEVTALRPAPARTPLVSCRTARPLRDSEAVDPAFWGDQIALPVRYWPALKSLLDASGTDPGLLLLDASPDRSLGAAARRHPAVRAGASHVLPLLAPAARTGGPADVEAFDRAMATVTTYAPPRSPARSGVGRRAGSRHDQV
ncbi:acyltransferase domain-containing protein [Streptomyces sp. NPDC014676]|uniref:acyltransferase domain-containing protein n=1 Tax=Streptomyces sp. NPDC014676 TaxID=3364879 RepID=UPI0036F9A90A